MTLGWGTWKRGRCWDARAHDPTVKLPSANKLVTQQEVQKITCNKLGRSLTGAAVSVYVRVGQTVLINLVWRSHTHERDARGSGCKPIVYKWKNHFYEMKGDVGMSVHEKERKQEDAYTKTQTHS